MARRLLSCIEAWPLLDEVFTDHDDDANPVPYASLWTVAAVLAGAGAAAFVVWRLVRRLDRGRQ